MDHWHLLFSTSENDWLNRIFEVCYLLDFMVCIERSNIKRTRAHGGCLGISRRWRTWQAAISFGEVQITVDPEISEWGNPLYISYSIPFWIHRKGKANEANWNILVASGKEIKRDTPSSGERTGHSPNRVYLGVVGPVIVESKIV